MQKTIIDYSKAIDESINLVEEINKDKVSMQNKIDELEKQIESMKCCGNCGRKNRNKKCCIECRYNLNFDGIKFESSWIAKGIK